MTSPPRDEAWAVADTPGERAARQASEAERDALMDRLDEG